MELFIKLLGTLLLAAVALFGVTFFLCSRSFGRYRSNKKNKLPADWSEKEKIIREAEAKLLETPCDELTIKSFDGLVLRGRLYHAEGEARRTLLCVHGYQSRGTRDFSCVTDFYRSIGCDVLVIDQRGCGKSDGKFITFGVKERYDALEWARLLAARHPDLPLFLDGISLGSATVMMTSDMDLPENTRGIIADCGFTSPKAICRHVLKKFLHLPVFPFLYIAAVYTRLFAGFSLSGADTLKSVAATKIPIMFVHGAADTFVPTYMTEQNFAACASAKKKYIIENAGHGMSYLTEPETCRAAIISFFEENGAL